MNPVAISLAPNGDDAIGECLQQFVIFLATTGMF